MPGGVKEFTLLHTCHFCGNIDKYKAWFHPSSLSEVFTCHMLWQYEKWSWIWPLAQSVQWITSRFLCRGKFFLRHCPFHSLKLFSPVLFQSTSSSSFVEKYFDQRSILFTSSFRLKIEQILTLCFYRLWKFMLHFAISKVLP